MAEGRGASKGPTKSQVINWTAVITALITAAVGVWQQQSSAKSEDVAKPINHTVETVERLHHQLWVARGYIYALNARMTALEGMVYTRAPQSPPVKMVESHLPMATAEHPFRSGPLQPSKVEIPNEIQAGFDRGMEQLHKEPARLNLPKYEAR